MERDYRIDLLRILACLMVVFIHVSAFGMLSGVGSFNWHIGNIYDSLVRSAVPLFVMISGAFLLSKNISYKEIFSKYILRILRLSTKSKDFENSLFILEKI